MADDQDPIETAWEELRTRWGDDDRHRSFVALAAALDRLPDAGRRYRELRDDPERGDGARRGLERVLGAAMARLSPARRDPPPPRMNWSLPVATLAALWVGTLVLSRALHRPDIVRPLVLAAELAAVLLIPWRRLARRGG